jgi:hypothetical protein
MHKTIVFLSLALMCGALQAQRVTSANTNTLQPQIGRDAKGYEHCGIRAVVVAGPERTGHSYDFSVNVHANPISGSVQAGKYSHADIGADKGKRSSKPILPAPVSFWFATADKGVQLAPKKFTPAKSEGFILGETEMMQAMTVVLDLAQGRPVQFIVRYEGEKVDQIVSFAQPLTATDREALYACLDGILMRMDKTANQSAKLKPAN